MGENVMSAITVKTRPTMPDEKTAQGMPPWINYPEFSSSSQWSLVLHVLNWSTWQVNTVKRILQFQSLQDNWDSYGSHRPSFNVIRSAVSILLKVTLDDPPMPRIVPVPGGGIQFEWRKGRRELEIEVRPDGSIEYLKIEGGNPFGDGEELELPSTANVESLLFWLIAG